MPLYPRRTTSTPTVISFPVADGTSFLNGILPSVYKQGSSFTTLQNVYNSIGSAGGFAPLGIASAPGLITTNPILANKGPLRSQMPTTQDYNNISPRSCMIQDALTFDADNQTAVWESAAWNGYGWFWIPSGGHRTGYRNDMYLVRIADPMMVVRLYNTSPILAAIKRDNILPNPAGVGNQCLVPPSFWAQYPSDGLTGFPEWGPQGAHHYDGMQFDPTTEKILWGGDTPLECLNPTAYGSLVQTRVVLSVFDVNASTPKSAWSRVVPTNWAGSTSIFGMVDQGNGWYEFSGYYGAGGGGKRYRYNPSTNQMTDVGPFISSGAVDFGHTARDAATGKVYETRAAGLASRLIELGGSLNVNLGLYEGDPYSDNSAEPIIVNGKAYYFGVGAAASVSDPTRSVPLGVARVNLSTGARDLITNGPSVPLVVGGGSACSQGLDINGLHGRVGYVPSVGAFVLLLSALHDVYVFRPPASWGP